MPKSDAAEVGEDKPHTRNKPMGLTPQSLLLGPGHHYLPPFAVSTEEHTEAHG